MHKTLFLVVYSMLALSGCASSYVTPSESGDFSRVSDIDIKQAYQGKPAANFPASIVYVRLEKAEHVGYESQSYGSGPFNVVTTWDFESSEAIARLSELAGVEGIAPLSKILIPAEMSGLKDLRLVAAKMHADILLVYTVESAFKVGKKEFGPLEVISLGFIDNKEVKVKAAASAAFYDVKTQYLYGLAEASNRQVGESDIWNKGKVVGDLRELAEREALHKLVPQIEATWDKIREEYGAARVEKDDTASGDKASEKE